MKIDIDKLTEDLGGISQVELAKRLAVSRETIRLWKVGEIKTIPPNTLNRIEMMLKIDIKKYLSN